MFNVKLTSIVNIPEIQYYVGIFLIVRHSYRYLKTPFLAHSTKFNGDMLNCKAKGSLVLVCLAFILMSNKQYGEVRYYSSHQYFSHMTAGSLIFNLNPEIYQQGVLQDVIYKLLKIFLFSEKNIYKHKSYKKSKF